MPKVAAELTDAQVRKLTHGVVKGTQAGKDSNKRATKKNIGEPCVAYHPVGGVSGLLLQCRPPVNNNKLGARSWILRTKVAGKRKDIGLGGYPDVTLSIARQKARDIKAKIAEGIDPIEEKKRLRASLAIEQSKLITFSQVASEYLEKKSKEYKHQSQITKITNQIKNYAFPEIGKLPVGHIERVHLVNILQPIWETKNETATRVRGHIESILDLATVKGLRVGENPARWKGNLELSFAAKNKVAKVKHFKALPVVEIKDFINKLRQQEWTGAKCLELIILTATRSNEARNVKWSEVDLENALWTIPADKMKAGKEHKVPLSKDAVQLLKSMPKLGEYIFPNSKEDKPLTDAAISKVPKRIGYDVTTHGFRSTFKDWSSEYTSYPDEVSELQLAHVNSDKTRVAYARSQLVDKRALMMADWCEFINNGYVEKVKAFEVVR